MKSRLKIKGYSLTELLIVIGILGAVTAIAIPAYRGLTNRAQTQTEDSEGDWNVANCVWDREEWEDNRNKVKLEGADLDQCLCEQGLGDFVGRDSRDCENPYVSTLAGAPPLPPEIQEAKAPTPDLDLDEPSTPDLGPDEPPIPPICNQYQKLGDDGICVQRCKRRKAHTTDGNQGNCGPGYIITCRQGACPTGYFEESHEPCVCSAAPCPNSDQTRVFSLGREEGTCITNYQYEKNKCKDFIEVKICFGSGYGFESFEYK